ncbi:MAG: hypothetical protein Q8R47_00345 [Nanoarchaeota archaeon]|nr:hypothetical protein [Nanoarchaeota archaeon]
MDDSGRFDQRIKESFTEEELHAKINRAVLGMEVRITLDELMKYTRAQLVSKEGRAIDVYPTTVERYQELCSLIKDYTKLYGKNPELEAIKERWKYSTDQN